MKKTVKFIIVIIAIILAGAWIYWQFNKKRIVRNAVENIITKKSDSHYYIHYDSSAIDAVAGNASFYNVSLQSDSLQKQLLQFDSSSAASIYNVHVGEISIHGANIPSLLSNQRVEASSIKLVRPVIYIIQSGIKKEKQFSREDTLAVYEKLLGKFKSIKAGEIIIEDGQLNISHKTESPVFSLKGINADIKNVRIDSTRDYDNLVSYFIKDAALNIEETIIANEQDNSTLTFTGLQYNAGQKVLKLANFRQKNNDSGRIIFDINNTNITGLNTDSFILKKQLKAEELMSDGGLMTFYIKKPAKNKNDNNDEGIDIDNNFFDEALLNKITLNKTRIVIYKRDRPGNPFILENVKFSASDIQNLYSGTNVRNLISRSNWNLSADGFSLITKNKIYKLSVGPFTINKLTGMMHVDYFSVKPLMTEAAYVKGLKEQTDLYNVTINNIDVSGIDTKKLVAEKTFIAETATIHPIIKVSNDRTVAAYTGSKVGNYPHQLIQKIKFPIYIKKIIAADGYITYTERSNQSKKQGTVFFSKANGTIENVTNIKEYIAKNNSLVLNAHAKLLGVSDLQTHWNLPLNTTNGSFDISGDIGTFNASILNPLIEPLALASITKGQINSVNFKMHGTDENAKGISTLLYKNLKIEALKNDSGQLKKRDLISWVANLVIKDENPKNNKTREGEIDIERDKTRSFFNLVWKGIFKAAKRTAIGKDDEK